MSHLAQYQAGIELSLGIELQESKDREILLVLQKDHTDYRY